MTAVSVSALMTYAGTLSGPAAFSLLRVMMALLISVFEGLSQLMGSSVSADGISGGESGVGWFSSSLKCSAHHFSCSLDVVSGFPFLSFTDLSVCWNLPLSFLFTRNRSLRFPCQAAVTALQRLEPVGKADLESSLCVPVSEQSNIAPCPCAVGGGESHEAKSHCCHK